jgi:ferredoxin
MGHDERTVMRANPAKCTGCRRCQLICAYLHTGRFSLDPTRIRIREELHGVVDVAFTDACDQCGQCVSYCVYGALWYVTEGAR